MRPLGGCFWGLLGPFFGPLGGVGRVGGLWGVLGASRGPPGSLPGASWGLLFPLWGRSWACPGALLGRLGRPLGPPGALLSRFGAVLEACWAGLAWFSGRLGLSFSVGKRKRREGQNPSKTNEKSLFFASGGPLGRPPGALLGRLGWLWGRLGAILSGLGGLEARLQAVFGLTGAVLRRLQTVGGARQRFCCDSGLRGTGPGAAVPPWGKVYGPLPGPGTPVIYIRIYIYIYIRHRASGTEWACPKVLCLIP